MKAEIKVNDKVIEVELTTEQIQELGLFDEPKKKKTGFEPTSIGGDYYIITTHNVEKHINRGNGNDIQNRASDNYFTSYDLASDLRRAFHLNLRMLKWQAENDEPAYAYDIEGFAFGRCIITYFYNANTYTGDLCPKCVKPEYSSPFMVYFSSEEKAWKAIEEFRRDLIWYHEAFKCRRDTITESDIRVKNGGQLC